MPEGDTIHRTARTLSKVLGGRGVTGFRTTVPGIGPDALSGRSVRDVEARGKNVLIHLDDGHTLYTHLRMTGSWHIYRTGERWRKPERRARVVLETDEFVSVCFSAPVVEILTAAELRRHPILSNLGPDLLDPRFDLDSHLREARRRLRRLRDVTIGEALLDQRAVAGIGNVYKSETLFLCGLHPRTRLPDIADDDLERVLLKARELMAANLEGVSRVTRQPVRGQELWVYGRSGRPCCRCGAAIRMRRQGDAGRSTYWCPGCQPTPR